MKTIVFGPPGTGKTTTLLNEVDKYLKETDPDKIGYFSFTQKAAYEARDRAMSKFNFSEKDLPYFRTFHSLAFQKLSLDESKVMQDYHYADLGRILSIRVNVRKDVDASPYLTCDNEYFQIILKAKEKCISVWDEYCS